VYVPVCASGGVWIAAVPFPPLWLTTVAPSGARNVVRQFGNVLPVTPRSSRWPAVASKGSRARCHDSPMATGTAAPPMTMLPAISDDSASVTLIGVPWSGSTRIAYVPVVGSGGTVRAPLASGWETSELPSGFRTEYVAERVAFTVPMVRRWPVLPLKVSRARCPWRAMFTFTDAPLIWMTPSARSWDSVSGALPVRVPVGATRMVYVPVIGSDDTWSDPPLMSVPPDVSTLPAGLKIVVVTLVMPPPMPRLTC